MIHVVRMRAEVARALATSELKTEIGLSQLTQALVGELRGIDARQVRRWLSGTVSLGPLELLMALRAYNAERLFGHPDMAQVPMIGLKDAA